MTKTKFIAKLAGILLAGTFAVACGGGTKAGNTTPKAGDKPMDGSAPATDGSTAPQPENGNPCSM